MYHLGIASPVHGRFTCEWQWLRRQPAALRHASGWRLVSGSLRDLDQIVELTLHTRPDAERERVLHDLVGRAQDDDLAARVLLQRLLPELVRVHRRRRWQHGADVDFGDLLATGWIVIRTYNTARRPARLANALVSDIEYREYRAEWRRLGRGRPRPPWCFDQIIDETSGADPTVELARLVSDPTAGLSDDDRDLVRRLMSGRQAIDIARELEITPRTLRNRRDQIAARLREVGAAA